MAHNNEIKSFCDDWKEFTGETSMHGMKYLHQEKVHIIRRVTWFLLIAGWLGYFCYAAKLFLTDVIDRKVTTKISVSKASSLVFPTVTICNKNLWRISVLSKASYDLGTDGMFEVLKDLYFLDRESPPSEDKYDWNDPKWAPIAAITPADTEQFLKDAAHPLKNTVLWCSSKGTVYDCSEFLKVVLTDAGYCYQFNGNGSFTSKASGISGGISLMMNAGVDEYSVGPSTYSEGFYVALHDSQEVPLVTELGIGISPGTQVSMTMQKSETIREPPPADGGKANCFDSKNLPNPLKYYSNYSYSACYQECKTQYVINHCQCRDMLQPALHDTPVCSIVEMLECSTPALRNFASDPEGVDKCNCSEPCTETEYSAKVSTFSFPSKNYMALAGYPEETGPYLKNNYALVDIFFGKLSYKRLEEFVPYQFEDAIANIGGTLGCCIGASLLTLCEFLEFGILSLLRGFKKLCSGRFSKATTSTVMLISENKTIPATRNGWDKYDGYN